MAKLFLMMGIPGSGKSTWCKNHISPLERYVSRDEIRFSLVSEKEEYFSKENQVYKHFIKQIDGYIKRDYDVFADATHLNSASRNKLLRSISTSPDEINIIWIKTSLEEALKRNENRKGTRSYVPRSVIRRMCNQIETPSFEEGIDKIYIIEDNKPIILKERG